ncbi:MaoC family dehydratase [Methylocapsa palsarum]|uniref:Acyl dehydratase n=1 Tax=Methylocapsa palsarum TaxID=1612308 RepID=A0A1I4BZQ2_9HYPH|nr:MaoC family dehydratase [Methylocapsa palsarum]SFK73993.1 Acyl dehydratase [Methylocapsa palsarum]
MDLTFYEDVAVGETIEFGGLDVTKQEILDFAGKFDPQPFHLDEAAAKGSMLKGLAASGWHTAAMTMRMSYDGFIKNSASMGAPGVDELTWRQPVRPGDRLVGRRSVLGKRLSRSRPEMGIVQNVIEVFNQIGQTVMTQKNPFLIARRGAATPPGRRFRGAPDPAAGTSPAPYSRAYPTHLEDLPIGQAVEIGAQTLTRDDIVGFARAFDPQPFHLDEDAAKQSHFGGLVASGWQTAALWMKTWIAHREAAEASANGESAPEIGPSPGVSNLAWPYPVYVGDTITYTTKCTGVRRISRPGWGLGFFENRGLNQDRVCVLRFDAGVFWRTRP